MVDTWYQETSSGVAPNRLATRPREAPAGPATQALHAPRTWSKRSTWGKSAVGQAVSGLVAGAVAPHLVWCRTRWRPQWTMLEFAVGFGPTVSSHVANPVVDHRKGRKDEP
jgi:hypothetical protein